MDADEFNGREKAQKAQKGTPPSPSLRRGRLRMDAEEQAGLFTVHISPFTSHVLALPFAPFASSARGFAFVFSLRSLRSFAACRAVGFAKEGLLNLPQRWDKAHLLELIKEPEQHFLGIDPFQETVPPAFVGVRHNIVLDVENGFAERPGDSLIE